MKFIRKNAGIYPLLGLLVLVSILVLQVLLAIQSIFDQFGKYSGVRRCLDYSRSETQATEAVSISERSEGCGHHRHPVSIQEQ
jgi:hypothetical protein